MGYADETTQALQTDLINTAKGFGLDSGLQTLPVRTLSATVADGAESEPAFPVLQIQATKVAGIATIDTPNSTGVEIYLALGVPQSVRVTKLYNSGGGTVATGIVFGY